MGVKGEWTSVPVASAETHRKERTSNWLQELKRGQLTLASDKLVGLAESEVMVDVTVFEQAPQLQTSQLKEAVGGLGPAESAVEPVDLPQLRAVLQHRQHHLWEKSCGLS